MTLYTFMNFLEPYTSGEPIDIYSNRLLGSLESGTHDDRYYMFMSEFGLYEIKYLTIDNETQGFKVVIE